MVRVCGGVRKVAAAEGFASCPLVWGGFGRLASEGVGIPVVCPYLLRLG